MTPSICWNPRDVRPRGRALRTRLLAAALVAALAAALAAPSAAADEDHPLVTRYPGSVVQKRDVQDFGKYALVVSWDAKDGPRGRDVEGRLTRLVYTNPADRSTLEIFRNYREAVEAAGGEVLFSCEMEACGPAWSRSAWNRVNGLFAASDGDPRYLAARIAQGDAEAYVAVMVGKRRTQLDVVEAKAMDRGLVAVDAEALAKDIEGTGTVRVYGILFDFDQAVVRPESKEALDAIAVMLRGKPDLSLFVVGHTDAQGSLTHNLELSRARARAVVDKLAGEYGIAAARLDAHGVGPLAPVAPNTSEDGRRQNRRVELVAR